eukprot:Macronucleus_7316.p1 GENE.Macronucleus_7316~~Macronucleus_7316.p1  ORF type:complete len:138 (+),score=46.73 Macronucleus_7316:1-414(+)
MFHSRNLVKMQKSCLQARATPSAILSFPRRYEGSYPWFQPASVKMPKESLLEGESFLDETEVQTRMSQIIHRFKLLDLHKLDWSTSFEQLGLDIYEQNAMLTSFEHEFHTVFEDRVFESFESFEDIKRFIAADHNCF